MGPITTCELLNDAGSPASETFVIFSPQHNVLQLFPQLGHRLGQVARDLQTLPTAPSRLLCASLTVTPEVRNLSFMLLILTAKHCSCGLLQNLLYSN